MANNNRTDENIELIRGDPKRAIRKLSVPTMMSMLILMIYNLADSLWVAGLGAEALAAVGFITPVFFIIINVGNGIGAGANSLIARAIGAENKELADNAAVHTLLLSIILSIIVPMILIPFMGPLLNLMGAGSSTQLGIEYGQIMFGFTFFFVLSGVLQSLLRAEGDVKRAMNVTIVTSVLNIVLDPIFIYPTGWGVSGAAWATVLSVAVSCVIMGWWIWGKKDTYLTVTRKAFEYKNHILKEIAVVAVPNMTEGITFSVMIIFINMMLTIAAGTTAVAVYTSAARINQLAMIPLMGIGTAMLTVAGAAFGQRDYHKLEEAHSYSIKFGYMISIVLIFIMFFGSDYIALLFAYSDQSASLAPMISSVLKILCFFLLAIPAGIMSAMVFQGVGKGFTSLAITVFRALIIELLLAYFLGLVLGFGEAGIYSGMVLAAAIGSVIAYIWCKLYIRGLKKKENYS